MGLNTRIPEAYLPDINQRLNMYQKLAAATEQPQLESYRREMLDRYGRLPQSVELLLQVMGLRLYAQSLYITKIRRQGSQVRLSFRSATPLSVDKVISLAQGRHSRVRLIPENELLFTLKSVAETEICPQLEQLLKPLVADAVG